MAESIKCRYCDSEIEQDGQPDKAWLMKNTNGKYRLICPLNKPGMSHEPYEQQEGAEE